jgi:phage-related minor tail protein
MDFQVNKRGSDFVLYTGVPVLTLQKYEKEYRTLSNYQKDGDNYIIPRLKLCDVLDACFDHFTEDSLMRITKLLDKNDSDMRDKITERSVSKRQIPKEHREKEQRERDQREREQRERDQREREQRERDQRERDQREREQREREQREREQREREQREREQRERDQREREQREREKEQRVKEIRDRSLSDRDKKKTPSNQDLNYDEPIHKTEILKMVSSIRNKLDSLERYVNRM